MLFAACSCNEAPLRKFTQTVMHLHCLLFLLLATVCPEVEAAGQAVAADRKLSILTSFSPTFYQPFIDAYKKENPDLQIKVLNKKTTAAIAEIQRGNLREFDIFWSSSPDAFAVLKDAGDLRYIGFTPVYRPVTEDDDLYGDKEGYFYNFACSSVGFMWNRQVLRESKVPEPTEWEDLAHPDFYSRLAISTPSRSGTNHLIVESLLQGMGWEQGWRFLLLAAGNLETITARSFSVPDGVADGRFGAGLVIDFLAINKMYRNENVGFSYGKPVFLMPAGIAVLEKGQNVQEAKAFIRFILSAQGQSILLSPSIGRLPVSRDAFSPEAPIKHPLLELIQADSVRPYGTELSRMRYPLVNALFDQLITYRLLERRQIWKELRRLERKYGAKELADTGVRKKVIDLLTGVPVSETESLDRDLNDLLDPMAPASLVGNRRVLLDQWENFVTDRFEKAEALLSGADIQLGGSQKSRGGS